MTYTIKHNRHRAWPRKLGIWYGKKVLAYDVRFDQSCAYNIEGVDMLDTNKLFGVGYFPNHHKHSARFGWRYVTETNRIMLSAYCYVNGERSIKDIVDVKLNEWVVCRLRIEYGKYLFDVITTNRDYAYTRYVEHGHDKKLSYPLGVYFGGNNPAPKTMTIELK